jgi:hypothetical protein
MYSPHSEAFTSAVNDFIADYCKNPFNDSCCSTNMNETILKIKNYADYYDSNTFTYFDDTPYNIPYSEEYPNIDDAVELNTGHNDDDFLRKKYRAKEKLKWYVYKCDNYEVPPRHHYLYNSGTKERQKPRNKSVARKQRHDFTLV